eukprot:gene14898-biopygen4089
MVTEYKMSETKIKTVRPGASQGFHGRFSSGLKLWVQFACGYLDCWDKWACFRLETRPVGEEGHPPCSTISAKCFLEGFLVAEESDAAVAPAKYVHFDNPFCPLCFLAGLPMTRASRNKTDVNQSSIGSTSKTFATRLTVYPGLVIVIPLYSSCPTRIFLLSNVEKAAPVALISRRNWDLMFPPSEPGNRLL